MKNFLSLKQGDLRTVDRIASESLNLRQQSQPCPINKKFACTMMPICQQPFILKACWKDQKIVERLFYNDVSVN